MVEVRMGEIDAGSDDWLAEPLTEREVEILRLKADNPHLLRKDIAARLSLAVSTVKWYTRQINQKLQTKSLRQAVVAAAEQGLIDTPGVPAARPRHNLPAQTTPFIGREDDLERLAALLADPDVRLVSICAPGWMAHWPPLARLQRQLETDLDRKIYTAARAAGAAMDLEAAMQELLAEFA